MRSLIVLAFVGCATDPEPIVYGDPEGNSELPPRGMGPIETWIAAGYFKSWHCEPEVRDERPGSPHGFARVCSNALLAAADPTALPIGVTSVKEIYDDTKLLGHAISIKVTDEGAPGWYWYEYHSKRLFNDGMNSGSCPDCHVAASAEYTFTIVR